MRVSFFVCGGLVYKYSANRLGYATASWLIEVPRVLFLGICLDIYFCLGRVSLPKFGFHRECLMVCVWVPNLHEETDQNDYCGTTRPG